MRFEDEEQERAEPIARHEAGHFVVARVLGFPTGKLTINDVGPVSGGGGSEIYLHTKLNNMDEVREYLRRRIQVLCAGAIAEHMQSGDIDEDAVLHALRMGGTARDDWAKVSENVHTLCSMDSISEANLADELERVALEFLNKAEEVVIAEARVIEAVAKELLNSMTRPGNFELAPEDVERIPEFKARFGKQSLSP